MRTDLVLALEPLLVLLAVLLLNGLVALDRLHELLLDEPRLLLADLAVAPATALLLERLDAPLEHVAQRTRVCHEVLELLRRPLARSIVGGVQRTRVQV